MTSGGKAAKLHFIFLDEYIERCLDGWMNGRTDGRIIHLLIRVESGEDLLRSFFSSISEQHDDFVAVCSGHRMLEDIMMRLQLATVASRWRYMITCRALDSTQDCPEESKCASVDL